jgi:RimJ/RimL family protein N-acetyltransferase
MTAEVPTLETPRLRLVRLGQGDAEAVQAIFPRWEIVQYLGNVVPWPYPQDGAASYIRDNAEPAMAAGRQWHWSLRLRDPEDRLVGVMSLMESEDNNRGFWLAPEWQGRGLMTEACIAANDFWFETLGKWVLRVPKAIGNERSRRISERMGMRVVGRREHDFVSGRLPAEVWEITLPEWRVWRVEHVEKTE